MMICNDALSLGYIPVPNSSASSHTLRVNMYNAGRQTTRCGLHVHFEDPLINDLASTGRIHQA